MKATIGAHTLQLILIGNRFPWAFLALSRVAHNLKDPAFDSITASSVFIEGRVWRALFASAVWQELLPWFTGAWSAVSAVVLGSLKFLAVFTLAV